MKSLKRQTTNVAKSSSVSPDHIIQNGLKIELDDDQHYKTNDYISINDNKQNKRNKFKGKKS